MTIDADPVGPSSRRRRRDKRRERRHDPYRDASPARLASRCSILFTSLESDAAARVAPDEQLRETRRQISQRRHHPILPSQGVRLEGGGIRGTRRTVDGVASRVVLPTPTGFDGRNTSSFPSRLKTGHCSRRQGVRRRSAQRAGRRNTGSTRANSTRLCPTDPVPTPPPRWRRITTAPFSDAGATGGIRHRKR